MLESRGVVKPENAIARLITVPPTPDRILVETKEAYEMQHAVSRLYISYL